MSRHPRTRADAATGASPSQSVAAAVDKRGPGRRPRAGAQPRPRRHLSPAKARRAAARQRDGRRARRRAHVHGVVDGRRDGRVAHGDGDELLQVHATVSALRPHSPSSPRDSHAVAPTRRRATVRAVAATCRPPWQTVGATVDRRGRTCRARERRPRRRTRRPPRTPSVGAPRRAPPRSPRHGRAARRRRRARPRRPLASTPARPSLPRWPRSAPSAPPLLALCAP